MIKWKAYLQLGTRQYMKLNCGEQISFGARQDYSAVEHEPDRPAGEAHTMEVYFPRCRIFGVSGQPDTL